MKTTNSRSSTEHRNILFTIRLTGKRLWLQKRRSREKSSTCCGWPGLKMPLFQFFISNVSPIQVLCRPDHSVCVRLLQSVRPKLYRGRSFPVFCWSGQLCLQLHWKAFLWHSHGQVQNMLVNIHKNILMDRLKKIFISRWSSQISGQATAQRWGWRWCSWPPWWPPSPPPRSLARWDAHKCWPDTYLPLGKDSEDIWARLGSLSGSGRFMQLFRELTQPSLQ